MIRSIWKRDGIVSSRTCVIVLLIQLLVFPPWMFGDQMTWNGGPGAYNQANWTCNNCDPNDTAIYPANGQTFNGASYNYNVSIQSGGGVNAAVTLDNIEQGLDAVTVDSMSIRGGHVASTASLTVQNGESLGGASALTIGNPASTQGNALYIGNRGSLNITDFSTVTLELSGGGGSLYPGAPNSVGAYIGSGGSVNVSDFGALQLQNTSGGTRLLTNNGTINIGADGAPAALLLSSQGIPSNFLLGGNGSLTMDNAYLIGQSGAESLTNGSSHTMIGNGLIEAGSFTNNGALVAAGPAGTLEVGALANYNGVTGKMTNGSYSVQDGSALQLDSVGLGNSITSLNLVNMQLTGAGAITGGGGAIGPPSSQSSGLRTGSQQGSFSSAISGLTHLTDSSLDLQGVSTTITPANGSGTLYLRSDPLGIPTTLTIERDSNQNGSSVTIAGNVKNISSTTVAPQQSDKNENQGSTINVSGSNLTVTGDLSSKAYVNPPEGFPYQRSGTSINVSGGSLTVGGNLNTYTNNGNANSSIGVLESTLTVDGNFRQGGGFGAGPISGGNEFTELTLSNLNVKGNFTNNNALNRSYVELVSSTANVTGWFGQFQGNSGAGTSQLTLDDGSSMTVGNLRNSTSALNAGTLGFTAQSGISLSTGSSLTVNGTFANIDANGVLKGGSYFLSGGSTLNYTGANITAIGANTELTLDGLNGTGRILNNGSNAISSSLNEVAGRLGLSFNAGLNLTSASGLTIDSGGEVGLGILTGGNNTLSAVSLTNNGQLDVYGSGSSFNAGTLQNLSGGILSGGTWNLNGRMSFGAGADGSTAITGLSGATVALGPDGGFFNNGPEAMTGLNSVASSSTLTINGQTRSFGPLNVDSSTLNLASGANVTFNGPAGSSGDGLSLTNGATMNVTGATATLNLAGGNTASITGSTLNVNDGGKLALTGGTSDTPGVVNVNTGSTLNLQALSSGPGGVLSVADGGVYQINGTGSVTNGGTIDVASGSLTVNANLTNLSGGTLSGGGTYSVGDGSTLQLSGLGAGNSLTHLSGANVSIVGTGVLTGGTPIVVGGPQVISGASSAPPPSALANLAEIDAGSTLSLRNAGSVTITPGPNGPGVNGLFLNNSTFSSSAPTLNLRDGTNLQINGDFTVYGGNVNITNGSSLNVGNSFGFTNVEGDGTLGGPMNLLIGSGSSLIYNGFDITHIAGTLTLGNREGNGTGTMQNLADSNPNHDALSYTLNTVYGTLNLQDGATLALNQAAGSFANQGNVTVTNGSTFDVSALGTNFTDVDGSGNLNGNYFIGSNSVLNYSGPSNITNINGFLTLDNSNWTNANPTATGAITNGGTDALSGSLASVVGTLNLQNNANLTLTGGQSSFTNTGQVNIVNNSTFDVSALGSNFSDIDGSGNQSGNYFIGSNSALNYSGANITAINGNLTLDNSNFGNTGGITIGLGNDALSGSLASINGTLALQNNAQLELSSSSGVTVNPGGVLNIDFNSNFNVQGQGNSTLTVDNKLTNYNAEINLGNSRNIAGSTLLANGGLVNRSDDNNSDFSGFSNFSSYNGYTQVTGNFFNGSISKSGLTDKDGADAETDLGGGSYMSVSGNLKNLALGGTGAPNPDDDTYSNASINLYEGSSLQVSGNVRNIAVQGQTDGFGFTTATASINLDGANTSMSVGGTFTNYGGNGGYGGSASLNLTNAATATVTGLFTNSGYSAVTLDGDQYGDTIGNGGSTLNANGGFKNYNSGVYLNNLSTLNVQGGFQNFADDSNNSAGEGSSILAIGGGPGLEGTSQRLTTASMGLGLRTSSEGFGFSGPSVATITGGLVNSASTSNNGYAQSIVEIGPGSTLNVDNLTNSAMAGSAGGEDLAEAGVLVYGTLNVTGNLSNTSSTPFFQGPNSPATIGSFGTAQAGIGADAGTLNIGGSFTNTNAEVDLQSSTLNSYNGILNLATDTNFDPYSPGATQLSGYSSFTLESDADFNDLSGAASTAVVKGGLTNQASSTLGGYAETDLLLSDGSTMTVSAPTSTPSVGPVYALTNLASATSFSSSNSNFTVGDPATTVPFIGNSANSLANASIAVDGSNGKSNLTVNGNFLNQSSVSMGGSNTGTTSWTIPLATAITTIRNGGGFTVNGNILNTTVVSGGSSSSISPAATINVQGASTLLVTGTFNNTAGTLNVSGSSTATVAGLFTNDSNSVVNLNQNDPQITEPTQYTQGSSLTTGHVEPSLPTTVLTTNGFSNAGAVNLNDNTMLVNTGTFLNTGNVTIGNGSILNTADNGDGVYSQTGGLTTIWAGGTLTADSIDITGGIVMGGGVENDSDTTAATFNGNVTNSATLNLGDPMALDVIGSYDQTMLGMLDLALAGVGDNGMFTGSLDDNNAYDQVNVTGNVLALDGALDLNLEAGFLSSVVRGDYFNVLNWTGTNGSTDACVGSAEIGCFGTFNDVTFTDSLGNLDTFVEQINADATGQELDLVVVGVSSTATPEPGTLSMLFCAMLIGGGVTWYRRKRRGMAE